LEWSENTVRFYGDIWRFLIFDQHGRAIMKNPKILLFKSRSVVSKAKNATPPLGLLYIASALRVRLGADIRILDALLETDPIKALRSTLRDFNPDVVGISALTAEAIIAHRAATVVKEEASSLPVIMGGPHPSSDPELVLNDSNIDAVVIGEGEDTFTELVRLIMSEGPDWLKPELLREVDGLAFRMEGKVELTRPRAPIKDLDSLPFPAWDLIDYKKFWNIQGMASIGSRPYLTMFTSRGCPYKCIYCHQLFGKSFRSRSPESVVEETAMLMKMGAGDIEVLDDIANFDQKRFDRILELMLEQNMHPALSFPNAIRADIMEEESVDLLKRVGTGEISVAIETASERLQKMLNKNLSLEKASRTINMLADRRIFTSGFFMIGFPTETEDEMLSTIRFAHSSRLHMAFFFTPNPYRNTGLYDLFIEKGGLPSCNSIDYEYFGAPFNASEISDQRYRMIYKWAYYGFYFNPMRAWRIALDRPGLTDIPGRVLNLLFNTSSFRRLRE
jgi:anaerobic magnesium-protoporphyrin IX monomethyl ester cyclase